MLDIQHLFITYEHLNILNKVLILQIQIYLWLIHKHKYNFVHMYKDRLL